MNKIIKGLLVGALISSSLYIKAEIDYSLSVRGALFIPTSSLYKDIYGKVGGSAQAEFDVRFCDWFSVWTNFDWLPEKGKSLGFGSYTRLRNATWSIGARLLWPLNDCFSLYLGAGPAFNKVWITNNGVCGCEKISCHSTGGLFKAGLYYFMTRHFFWDLFVDYLYQPSKFRDNLNIGGVKIGLGLGVYF